MALRMPAVADVRIWVLIFVIALSVLPQALMLPLDVNAYSADQATCPGNYVHIVYIYSSTCINCDQADRVIKKTVADAQRNSSVKIVFNEYEFNSPAGMDYARRYGLGSVPALILNNNTVIRFEDYNGDTRALGAILKEKVDEAVRYRPSMEIDRKITKASADRVVIATRIKNIGIEPVHASLSGGICNGIEVISGDYEWSGTLMPGEERQVICEAYIRDDVREMPAQSLVYEDSHGKHMLPGPKTPVLLVKRLSVVAVFFAGLLAGINPCLLAVMAFIATMAMSAGEGNRGIMLKVLAFCSGLLLVYLLMGIGFLGLMRHMVSIDDILRPSLTAVLVLLSVWMFYDAYRTHKDGSRRSAFRSLLEAFTPAYSRFSLAANFLLGGAFGLIKMPCVGGMYIAILGAVIDSNGMEVLSGLTYLFMYNLAVILPVLVLGALLAFGLSPERMNAFRYRYRTALKIISGIVLLLMATGFMLGVI